MDWNKGICMADEICFRTRHLDTPWAMATYESVDTIIARPIFYVGTNYLVTIAPLLFFDRPQELGLSMIRSTRR